MHLVLIVFQVKLPVPDEAAFLDTLLQWSSQHAENVLQRDAIMHTISSVINKRVDGMLCFNFAYHSNISLLVERSVDFLD